MPSLFGRGAREVLAGALHHSGALRGISRLRSMRPPRSLAVLAYHRLVESPPGPAAARELFADNVIEGDRLRFERQLRLLRANRHVIGLDELRASLHGGERLPPAPLLITFDDGYRSCIDIALPVLRELNLRATFFIATGYLQERRLFWWDAVSYLIKSSPSDCIELELPAATTLDRRVPGALVDFLGVVERLPSFDVQGLIAHLSERTGVDWNRAIEVRLANELLMTWDDVRQLQAEGMDVAAHTRTHRVLQTLESSELEAELKGSRQDLARYAGVDTSAIAYPGGYPVAGQPQLESAVRAAGFDLGFTFGGGHNRLEHAHPLGIHRMPVDAALRDSMHHLSVTLPSLGYQSTRAVRYQHPD